MKDEDKSKQQLIDELRQVREANARRAEEALRASELRYRRLFQSAQDGILILDFETGQILDVNPFLIDMLGLSHEKFLGKKLWEIGFFRDAEETKTLFAELQEKGYVRYENLPLRTTDGRGIDVEFVSNSYPVNGTTFIQCNIRDITERRRAEEALEESEKRYRAVVDNIEVGISLLDSNMEIVEVNKALKTYFPHVRPACGQICYEQYNDPPRSEPCSYCPCVLTFQDGKRHEVTTETPAGSEIRYYHLISSPIKDSDGRVQYVIELTFDVTNQKRSEENLRKSEKRYRTLFEESIDGVVSILWAGEITDANPSFCELLGYTREEIIGKNIRECYLDPAERTRFQKEIEKKGFLKDYEIKLRKKDGTTLDCQITASVHSGNDGTIAEYRGMVRDVTSRKKLQGQLLHAQKMESIGTMAGGIAHDFNNILTVVMGFSELLLIGKDERNPSYADLQKIHHAARRGAVLVKGILAFSRKADVNPLPLNLNHEIEQAAIMLTRTIAKMIDVELVLSDRLAVVDADPTQLEQVLINLAVNASHAMPDGGKLTIETQPVTLDEEYCRLILGVQPGDYVMLSVSDTGHGMDHETLTHIFEPFFTTKETGEGTGLGLAMVYGIVKQHDGHITCYSEPGVGTTFKIYLPVVSTEAKSETTTDKPVLLKGTETVLLVDDEDLVRDLGKRILERFGYTVLTAGSGKDALDLYKKERHKISLVILDLMMPKMGGKECLEELLRIDPNAKVLISSGFTARGLAKETLESRAKGFVGKPYNMRQMLEAVREVLDQPY